MPVPEKHIFQNINTDLELRYMQQGMYRSLLNGVVGASDQDNLGAVENALGTIKINNAGISSGQVMGIAEDKETNTIIYFVNDNTIWRFSPDTEVFTKVLDWDGLNFNYLITGAEVINSSVIWTDNNNNIRKVHIENAIAGLYEEDQQNFTNTLPNGSNVAFVIDSVVGNVAIRFPNQGTMNVVVTTGTQPSGAYTVFYAIFNGTNTIVYTTGTYVGLGSGTIDIDAPIIEEDITLLRRGPRFPLEITKTEDENFEQNHLTRNSFQFTYRYVYWDNEKSVFAPMSKIALIARQDDGDLSNDNNIICRIPSAEDLRLPVKRIEWVFRVNNTNEFAIFKVTERSTRSVNFRNDVAGVTLADAEVLKSFDDVPRKARGLRAAENRAFINDFVTGYDKTSVRINATVDSTAEDVFLSQTIYQRKILTTAFWEPTEVTVTYDKPWWKHPSTGNWFKIVLIDYSGVFGGYVEAGQGEGILDSDMAYEEQNGIDTTVVYEYPTVAVYSAGGFPYYPVADIYLYPRRNVVMFKAGDYYQVGVRFLDSLGRNIGVHTSDAARVQIPEHIDPRDMEVSTGALGWELTHNEDIPDWATHYEIVRTRNLSKSIFLQGAAGTIRYGVVTKDPEAGETLTFVNDFSGDAKIYFHIENSIKYKIGYVYSEGDRIKFFLGDKWFDAKLEGQEGPWVYAKNVLDGDLYSSLIAWNNVFYEIYTPYSGALSESFYEIGEKYAINYPGTASKAYSVSSGTLNGDIFRKQRKIYAIDFSSAVFSPPDSVKIPLVTTPVLFDFEAMNPNDDYYEQWVSDLGRPTLELPDVREQRKKFTLKYGGNYSVDFDVNLLSTFNAFDEYPMPLESGPAVCLASTNNNILFFHEREVSSIYINEGFISNVDGGEGLIRSVETVGDDRKLKGGHGTLNPESIAEFADMAWWWNIYKGSVVRYSNEGLVILSDNGMKNYFYKLSRTLLPYKDESKVYGVYDSYYDYYILTFAPVAAAGYAGETFAFNKTGAVGWYSFMPEMYFSANRRLYSFKDAQIWEHTDAANCNTFYGVKYDRVIKFVGNQEGSDVKIWANFRIDAESITVDEDADEVIIRFTNDRGQEGWVYAHQVENREGVYIGAFRQDVNTPNADALAFNGDTERKNYFMYNGDVLRSQVCEVEITNDRLDTSPLYFVTLLYRKSEVSFK